MCSAHPTYTLSWREKERERERERERGREIVSHVASGGQHTRNKR